MIPVKNVHIRALQPQEEPPYDLLLLADPSRELIHSYIHDAHVFLAEFSGKIIGCYVLYPLSKTAFEIKNIAVSEAFQGQGIGALLINHACETAKNSVRGVGQIQIGTGNSSTGQLHLYQKCGFKIAFVIPNFFIQNYPQPIYENGVQCTDMIVLTKQLTNA